MNPDDFAEDRLAAVLSTLRVVDVAPARAGQIEERCRAALARGRRAAPRGPCRAGAWRRVLEPALVAAVSAAFLLEVVGRALSLEGF